MMVPGFPSHVELAWEYPRLAHFYRQLASICRLIVMDKRGIGLSDRVPPAELPGLEQRADDVRAVLDDVGVTRAALIGASDGGPLAALFAATYPDRTDRLVLINTYARRLRTDDYPWGPSAEEWAAFQDDLRQHWGQPLFMDVLAPGQLQDAEFIEWWARLLRQSVSLGSAAAYLAMNTGVDVRSVLSAIHVPTLVIHRSGDRINPIGGGQFMAARIPGARLVELPGEEHHPWLGDAAAVLGEIEEFLTGQRSGPPSDRVLATLLFTDIVTSTETAARLGDRDWNALLETHRDVVRSELKRFGGREVGTTGDGFLATFDGPARAVRCGLAIVDRLAGLGIQIRAGVHTSEVVVSGNDVAGLGVHVAARIMALAKPGEVLVSSVVRDLALGSGLAFGDRGRHTLKGVDGEWSLLAATPDAERRGVAAAPLRI
ncbi:MAG: alpha/beta fold hydrolase [Chloroflexi bacterium]|nr:alpha/beta fold hydrolase [Chloroflexota bacterium]